MKLKDILFIIAVILIGITAIIVIFPDLCSGAQGMWDSVNPFNDVIDEGKEVGEHLSGIGNIIAENPINNQINTIKEEFENSVKDDAEKANNSQEKEEVNKIKSTVIRVKDGDTYVLDIEGIETTVRLIGIDTPESVAPDEYYKENSEEGIIISDIVKGYLKAGDTVYVEYDVGRTDTYGRTLAYVYFESGLMIQEWLLQNGFAQVMTIQPNSKYAERFVNLEQQAMASKIGIWKKK